MSTNVLAAPLPRAAAADRPGLGRLTLVELRKMTDTRAGFWLLLATAGLTVLVAVVACLVFPDDESSERGSRRRWRYGWSSRSRSGSGA